MKFKLEKKLKIVNELITCFHKLGNTDIHLDLSCDSNNTYFTISGEIFNLTNNDIDSLNKILNTPRQHEVEQYYWNLNGESELDCELSLVGMMVDKADISYLDNILTIKIMRSE